MTRVRRTTPWVLGSLLLFGLASWANAGAPEIEPEWQTLAERSGWESTDSYDETLRFLGRLVARHPALHLTRFGVSPQGRDLPLLIVSRERAFTPQAAQRLDKPIVLIQCGIHAGEIDGKDAMLQILREIALGRADDLLDAATLLVIPIYNVDGHERVSPFNRPNQDGPRRGMGFRTTSAGHDLNRDHLKLETTEARALIQLVATWQPHLHVDNHVTDGAELGWDVMFAWVEPPAIAEPIDRWRRKHLMPVLDALHQRGFGWGPYLDLDDRLDPTKGFTTGAAPPRYSTSYFALRQTLSILVETHSHKPFQRRVETNRAFLELLLRSLDRPTGRELTQAVAAAREAVSRLGRRDAAPSRVAIDYRSTDASDPLAVPLHPYAIETSAVTGQPVLVYQNGPPRDVVMPWRHTTQVARDAPRPRGYLLLPGWTVIENRLAWHGLRFERLERVRSYEVERFTLGEPQFAATSYQGRHAVTVTAQTSSQRFEAPVGSLWIPADQPLFELAVQLLEPEAPDALLRWGMLSGLFETKEWITDFVLERWVRERLQEPEWAERWQGALADPTFSADPQARERWWRSRHPATVAALSDYPVLRVVR